MPHWPNLTIWNDSSPSPNGGLDQTNTVRFLGTRNVLSSCHKLGVKRVALTSSTGSVYVTGSIGGFRSYNPLVMKHGNGETVSFS